VAPLHPAPTIDAGLILITQPLRHALVGRDALVTCAALDTASSGAQDLADDWQANWNTQVAPALDNNVTSLPPTIRLGDGSNVPLMAIGSGAAVAGTFSAADLPPQVAVLVKKNTGLGGKKNRGRMYIPWQVPGSVVGEDGTILAANVTAIQVNFGGLLAGMAADDMPMHIANKHLVITPPESKPHVDAIHTGALVTSLHVENVIATQRRRLPR
jgi:hypothetical protein